MWSPGFLRVKNHQQYSWLGPSLGVGRSSINCRVTTNVTCDSFSLGVPYQAWRITHAKHHASTGHMTQDQVFVPPTRSQVGLPLLNVAKEDRLGSRVSEEVKREFKEALGDSPIGAMIGSATYLVSSRLVSRTNCI